MSNSGEILSKIGFKVVYAIVRAGGRQEKVEVGTIVTMNRIAATSGSGATGNGITTTSAATNGNGLSCVGAGTGADLSANITGGITGDLDGNVTGSVASVTTGGSGSYA